MGAISQLLDKISTIQKCHQGSEEVIVASEYIVVYYVTPISALDTSILANIRVPTHPRGPLDI